MKAITEEIFKDIVGYEGKYQVSNFGNVKTLKRKDSIGRKINEKLLKKVINYYGYYTVPLSKNGVAKNFIVHQLVAVAFLNHVPCGYKKVVDHIDFNRLNNHISNLRLISARENTNLRHIRSSSEYTGVAWDKKMNKWRSVITINKKLVFLGLFESENKASISYKKALQFLDLYDNNPKSFRQQLKAISWQKQ